MFRFKKNTYVKCFDKELLVHDFSQFVIFIEMVNDKLTKSDNPCVYCLEHENDLFRAQFCYICPYQFFNKE